MPPPNDQPPRVTPEELRAWLRRHRMSQIELARRLPAARSSVNLWLSGSRDAPRWLVRALRDLALEIKTERAASRAARGVRG